MLKAIEPAELLAGRLYVIPTADVPRLQFSEDVPEWRGAKGAPVDSLREQACREFLAEAIALYGGCPNFYDRRPCRKIRYKAAARLLRLAKKAGLHDFAGGDFSYGLNAHPVHVHIYRRPGAPVWLEVYYDMNV